MSSVLALPSEEKPRKAGFSGSGSGNAQHWRCKGRAPTVADSSSEGGRTQEAGEKQISDSYDSWALAFPAAWHVLWPKLRRSTCPQATPCHTYPLSLCPTHAKPFQPAWVSSESLADDSIYAADQTREHTHTRTRDGAEARRRFQRLHRAGSTPLHKSGKHRYMDSTVRISASCKKRILRNFVQHQGFDPLHVQQHLPARPRADSAHPFPPCVADGACRRSRPARVGTSLTRRETLQLPQRTQISAQKLPVVLAGRETS